MKKLILISGTPGTGKTSIAKAIANHYGYEYIGITGNKEYVTGEEGGVKVIDIKKMINWLKGLQEKSNKILVVDSHLSHYYPKEYASICIIMRCDPQELRLRLKERGYNDKKIKINLEAEALDLILQEAIKEGHLIHEIDTTNRSVSSSAWEAIKVIDKSKKPEYGKIDYSYYLASRQCFFNKKIHS